jgi:hypothetical protein
LSEVPLIVEADGKYATTALGTASDAPNIEIPAIVVTPKTSVKYMAISFKLD